MLKQFLFIFLKLCKFFLYTWFRMVQTISLALYETGTTTCRWTFRISYKRWLLFNILYIWLYFIFLNFLFRACFRFHLRTFIGDRWCVIVNIIGTHCYFLALTGGVCRILLLEGTCWLISAILIICIVLVLSRWVILWIIEHVCIWIEES